MNFQISIGNAESLLKDSIYGRIIIAGAKNNYAYYSKFYAEASVAHSDLLTSSLTMTALSSGSYDITSTSGISFSSSTSQSVTTTSYTNQTVTYQLISGSSYISDAKFLVSSQSFLTIIENTYIELSPDLTCSTLGSTSITYSIENYNGETAPSWVVINSTSGVLKVTAPSVSSASTYSFYASSFVSGATGQVQKVITLQVNKCTVQNCKTCSSSSGSICVSCNSQYVLNSNVCNYHRTVTPTLEAVAAETTATVTVVATVSVVVVSQMLNASSVCTIWSVVNLIQSLFYLLLLRVYLPDDVYFFIMGMKVALFPFDIFKFKTTSTSTSVTSLLDFDQPDDTLSNIGLDSGSSFVNNYSLFTTLIAYAIFHVYFIVVMKLIRKINIATKFPRCSEITNKFMKKIYYFMTFTIYLRTFIEGYQFLLMSSMFEIHYFTNSSFKHIVSFSIACAIALLCLALLIFVFLISIFRKPEVIKDDKLGEIFKEIKEKKHSRLYTFQILLKKSFNVALVAYLSFEYSYACIILMALFQLLYTVFLIIQRPLEEPKSNLIEIINEIFLSILMTCMLYYNNESRWTSTASQSAIWMFCGVNITIFLITAVDAVKEIIKTIRNRRRSTQITNATMHENTQRNMQNQHEERIFTDNMQTVYNPQEHEEEKNNMPKTIHFISPTTLISNNASPKAFITDNEEVAIPENEEVVIPYEEIA